jgi:trigger factor
MMKVEVQTPEPCRRKLHIEVPAEDVRPDYEKILRMFLNEGSVPGFRKGKAPRNLIERKYAKSIEDEFRHSVVARAYREAIKDQGLSIVAVVGVENVQVGPASGLVCDVSVDVAPEFELPSYKGIPIKRQEVVVADKDVEDSITAMRERMADYKDAEAGYTAVEGDACQLDYEATADGQPLEHVVADAGTFASAKDAWAVVGRDGSVVPGMGEVLPGVAPGTVREFDTTFPDEHPNVALRGRTAHYRVTVKTLRQRNIPALDEAFCKRLGVESEEAFRNVIRQRMERDAERREEGRRRDELAGYLLRNTTFDVPRTLVDQETRSAVQQIVQDSMRAGMTREQLTEQQAAIVQTASEHAQQRLRVSFILTRIAEAEKIEATKTELDGRIAMMAHSRGTPVEQVRAEVEDRYGMDGLANDIRCNKAMDWLLANAKEA